MAAQDDRPLVLGGAPTLVGLLHRGLTPRETSGSDLGSVRTGDPAGGALYVYLLAGDPGEPEERDLRAASRAGVPIVAVVPESLRGRPIPYVLATDVVVVERGEAMPVDRVARAIARRLGEAATPLAARLPALRQAVCEELVALVLAQERDHRGHGLHPRRGHAGPDAEPAPPRRPDRVGARVRPEERRRRGARGGRRHGLRLPHAGADGARRGADRGLGDPLAASRTAARRAVGEAATRWFEERAARDATTEV